MYNSILVKFFKILQKTAFSNKLVFVKQLSFLSKKLQAYDSIDLRKKNC